MKLKSLTRVALLMLLTLAVAPLNFGYAGEDDDHSDIILGYKMGDPTIIDIEGSPGLGGILLFTADFGGLDSTIQPGFATEAAEGFAITYGHNVYLRAINAGSYIQNGGTLGLGYVNRATKVGDNFVFSAVGEFKVKSNADTSEMNLNGTVITGGPVFINKSRGDANDPGGIHDHLDFDFENGDDAAYGVLFQLFTENGGFSVAESLPFWLVFNRNSTDFAGAVDAFGSFQAVPEPSGLLLLGSLALGAVGLSRRRR
ncbi:MAG: PEP-CTERM sorting domain-containing protein [Pirellulaceae bacterium]|nr:PEP-CTERM sorting domain-containing protein [Pirellulaceae bacterium]